MNIEEIYPRANEHDMPDLLKGLFNSLLIRTNFVAGVRHKLGWRGLKYTCRNGEAWTCRVSGMEGVYGIYLSDIKKDNKNNWVAIYELCYFPDPEEYITEYYSIEAVSMIMHYDYRKMLRDFLCYPSFYPLFRIAGLRVALNENRSGMACTLSAMNRYRTFSEEGIYYDDKDERNYIIEPGGINQDIPAFELAYPFSEVLFATISYNLDQPASRIWSEQSDKSGDRNLSSLEEYCLGSFTEDDIVQGNNSGEQVSRLLVSWKNSAYSDLSSWHVSLSDYEPAVESLAVNKDELGIDDKPELVILTGYLGSGKTSFLKHFIEYHTINRRFVAVIQNEIGKKGLDGKLMEDDYALLEIDEGCVCCSLVGQLKKGIKQILANYYPDVIVLETTGLANPFNLLSEISELGELVKFDTVITTVDIVNFSVVASRSEILIDQVKAASEILLNKSDLAGKNEMSKLKNDIKKINADARIYECSHGDINPAILSSRFIEDKKQINCKKPSERDEIQTHEQENMSSRKIDFNYELDRDEFITALTDLPESIYRIKGVIKFRDRTSGTFFQYVNGAFEFDESSNVKENDNYLIFIGNRNEISKIKQNNFFNLKINYL